MKSLYQEVQTVPSTRWRLIQPSMLPCKWQVEHTEFFPQPRHYKRIMLITQNEVSPKGLGGASGSRMVISGGFVDSRQLWFRLS